MGDPYSDFLTHRPLPYSGAPYRAAPYRASTVHRAQYRTANCTGGSIHCQCVAGHIQETPYSSFKASDIHCDNFRY